MCPSIFLRLLISEIVLRSSHPINGRIFWRNWRWERYILVPPLQLWIYIPTPLSPFYRSSSTQSLLFLGHSENKTSDRLGSFYIRLRNQLDLSLIGNLEGSLTFFTQDLHCILKWCVFGPNSARWTPWISLVASMDTMTCQNRHPPSNKSSKNLGNEQKIEKWGFLCKGTTFPVTFNIHMH